ncbi:MAG: hypothetical protein LAT76_02915 [Schleiferiaceae bacterium]|nr:hypothetical protein [Schleiferiaceae bacterium]
MRAWFLLVVVLLCSSFNAHEFYVSVFEIELHTSKKTVELGAKLFTDDLERALSEFHDTPIRMDTLSLKQGAKWLLPYLQEHILMQQEAGWATWQWVGFESDPDVTYVYLEAKNSVFKNSIPLQITVFFDQYASQVNIAHIKHNGKEKSAMFSMRQPKTVLTF